MIDLRENVVKERKKIIGSAGVDKSGVDNFVSIEEG